MAPATTAITSRCAVGHSASLPGSAGLFYSPPTMKPKTAKIEKIARPAPPESMMTGAVDFVPAPEVGEWVERVIFRDTGLLHNPDHHHLIDADLCFMWANGGFEKQGRSVVGQAEQVLFRCSPWQKRRQEQQMRDWFGNVPDFLITLDAKYSYECSDTEFCALVEHELYHIAQQLDDFGTPAFTRHGYPKLEIRGHDVEEFVGVVRRYGVGHPEGRLAQLVAVAQAKHEVSDWNVRQACGTCLLKVA